MRVLTDRGCYKLQNVKKTIEIGQTEQQLRLQIAPSNFHKCVIATHRAVCECVLTGVGDVLHPLCYMVARPTLARHVR